MQEIKMSRQEPRPAATTRFCTAIVLAALACGVRCAAADLPPRRELGRSVKLRILVDKVMQPVNHWVTQEWMVKAAAQAGFNAYSPRVGFDRPREVRQVAQWCLKYGIYYLPWMRGTLAAPAGPAAAGARLVWANGVEQPLWSPNSREFWDWTRKYVLEYAGLSRRIPSVLGVFLDYENYAPGKVANAYSLSFDRRTLDRFAAARGIPIPDLAPGKRREWLKAHGQLEAYRKFQLGLWRRYCRELRTAVDRINPAFRFCVYPAPGTPFIREAVYPEWATPAAPLLLADAVTYGRPSRFIPQDQALIRNRAALLRNREIPRNAGIPFVYLGGIDPVVSGADPEFCGKNAVAISSICGGYWVFYEGPKYKVDHPHYWRWFTWANRAIAAGRLTAWKEPRQEPDTWFSQIFSAAGTVARKIVPPAGAGKKITYKPVHFRGQHLLVLPATKNRPVHVSLQWFPVGRYQSPLAWEVRGPDGAVLRRGKFPGKRGIPHTVTFVPDRTGMYLAAVSAGLCAWAVAGADVPVGIVAGDSIHLIGAPYRLYFTVPPGLKRFSLKIRGEGVETIRVAVRDPRGRVAAQGETSVTLNHKTLHVPVPPETAGQGVWRLETAKAHTGVVEDNRIRFEPKFPWILALDPGQVVRFRRR